MKKKIINIVGIVFLGLAAVLTYAYFQYNTFLKQPIVVTADNSIFSVKPGSNLAQVATQLESKGIIQDSRWFELYGRVSGKAHQLKAGEYKLENGVLPDALLSKLTSGQTIQYQLTILEGKTYKDIMAAVKQHPQLKQTLTDGDYVNIMAKVGGAAGMSPEGWFLPDTYNFPRNTTDLEFLQRSYKAMQTYLQKAWEKREPTTVLRTPYDALILASIVEKETGLPEERPLVARVFLNRLERGMLLQTDPSVIYGMGDKYTGNIRKTDLQTDTPYNTYTRKGLTPTPIATPSKAAIDAVLHPSNSKVIYFVATTPGGASKFSETLDEHNRAVHQYILNRNKAATPVTPVAAPAANPAAAQP